MTRPNDDSLNFQYNPFDPADPSFSPPYKPPTLWLWADLPAFTVIGQSMNAVDQASWQYEEGKPWRELVSAHRQATETSVPSERADAAGATPGRYRFDCGPRDSPTWEQLRARTIRAGESADSIELFRCCQKEAPRRA